MAAPAPANEFNRRTFTVQQARAAFNHTQRIAREIYGPNSPAAHLSADEQHRIKHDITEALQKRFRTLKAALAGSVQQPKEYNSWKRSAIGNFVRNEKYKAANEAPPKSHHKQPPGHSINVSTQQMMAPNFAVGHGMPHRDHGGDGQMRGRGHGPIDRALFKDAAEQAYESLPSRTLGDFHLVYTTPTLKFWQKNDLMLVGIRGTKDGGDVIADGAIAVGRLDQSPRFKKDLEIMKHVKASYPTLTFYGAGHSLGAAILDLFISMGFIKEGVSYNGALQLGKEEAANTRVYNKGDALYVLSNPFLKQAPETRTTKRSLAEYLSPMYGLLQQHKTAMMGAGKTLGTWEHIMAINKAVREGNKKPRNSSAAPEPAAGFDPNLEQVFTHTAEGDLWQRIASATHLTPEERAAKKAAREAGRAKRAERKKAREVERTAAKRRQDERALARLEKRREKIRRDEMRRQRQETAAQRVADYERARSDRKIARRAEIRKKLHDENNQFLDELGKGPSEDDNLETFTARFNGFIMNKRRRVAIQKEFNNSQWRADKGLRRKTAAKPAAPPLAPAPPPQDDSEKYGIDDVIPDDVRSRGQDARNEAALRTLGINIRKREREYAREEDHEAPLEERKLPDFWDDEEIAPLTREQLREAESARRLHAMIAESAATDEKNAKKAAQRRRQRQLQKEAKARAEAQLVGHGTQKAGLIQKLLAENMRWHYVSPEGRANTLGRRYRRDPIYGWMPNTYLSNSAVDEVDRGQPQYMTRAQINQLEPMNRSHPMNIVDDTGPPLEMEFQPYTLMRRRSEWIEQKFPRRPVAPRRSERLRRGHGRLRAKADSDSESDSDIFRPTRRIKVEWRGPS